MNIHFIYFLLAKARCFYTTPHPINRVGEVIVVVYFWLCVKMGLSRPLIVLFSSFFRHKSNINRKSLNAMLGIQTQGGRMVGAVEYIELWGPPILDVLCMVALQFLVAF